MNVYEILEAVRSLDPKMADGFESVINAAATSMSQWLEKKQEENDKKERARQREFEEEEEELLRRDRARNESPDY